MWALQLLLQEIFTGVQQIQLKRSVYVHGSYSGKTMTNRKDLPLDLPSSCSSCVMAGLSDTPAKGTF